MWIVFTFFKNIELCKKFSLQKKKATEVINFGFSNPDEEKLILSKKSNNDNNNNDFKDSVDEKEDIT